MALVLRTIKGTALTNQELDDNFVFLNSSITSLSNDLTQYVEQDAPAAFADVGAQISARQPLNAKLSSISSVTTDGILSIKGEVVTPREILAGSANIIINNGTGTDGNPVIDIAPSVATLTGTQTFQNKIISGNVNTITDISLTTGVTGTLPVSKGGTGATTVQGARTTIGAVRIPVGTGLIVQTGTDATQARTIAVSGNGLAVANANGVAGNPLLSINSTALNTAETIVFRDANGNFAANAITANTFFGSLAGNATTVTNGVYTNGSYSNPAWITSLAGTKVTSIPNTSLQNSSITINGVPIPLGGSVSIPSDMPSWTSANTPNTIVVRNASGNFAAGTITANLTGNVTGNLTGNVSGNTAGTHNGPVVGNVTGNVTGTASGNVAKSGDVMTGYLTLNGNPVNTFHAATKQYVDSRVVNYTFTSGTTSAVGYSNSYYFEDWTNWFDVYPPAGKSMGNLVAFIPSMAYIYFGGRVDYTDALRCVWVNLGNRIRVYVQNTEQRGTPAANWLAIWS